MDWRAHKPAGGDRRTGRVASVNRSPVSRQLRLLVISLVGLTVALAVVSLLTLHYEFRDGNLLNSRMGPAAYANDKLAQAVSDADRNLMSYQVTGEQAELTAFRD